MMNCIIIEDESNAADFLEYQLSQIAPEFVVLTKIDSVKNAVQWLSQNTTDLIFLDINLSDGNSFAIFEQLHITTPIIFCTAYDEYALKAFSVNSISYLLKPIAIEDLTKAINKFTEQKAKEMLTIASYEALLGKTNKFQQHFMFNIGNTLVSITSNDIAFVFTSNKTVIVVTLDNKQYQYNATLDQMEKKLNPQSFFRINRQYIIQLKCIAKMQNETRGRVKIETKPLAKEEMIVSIDRSAEFKKWINS